MSESLLSPSWYRVASLRPRVRGHARFHRHCYRGQLWMVLEDPASGRSHRLSAAAYALVGLMNGSRTTQEIWELACERHGDDAPTQDETLRILGLLHAADVLQCDLPPDTAELLARRQRRATQEWWRRIASPLSQRVPLFDPSPLLDRCERYVRPLFGRGGATLWCAVVGAALLAGIAHAPELAAGATRDLLEPANLLLIALAYPIVKALHEAGHALATRAWGGDVHEVGVLFLVFFPMPYVDASASAAFPDKRKRMAVGAAGIAVELFLSAVALFLWLLIEPGVIRSLCYDVMLIGGTSTLLFNGNPLMRYDGYYVLADAIEVPNLDARSRQYLSYLAQRHLLGVEAARNPATAPDEAPWLALYALCAVPYRFAVGIGIALFLANRYFVVGIALALLTVGVQIVVPLARLAHFLASSPRLAERRERALLTAAGLAGAGAVLVAVVPVPAWTLARGVVWPAEHAEVRAGADGFVTRLIAAPGGRVSPGSELLAVRDPTLDAEVAVLEARREEVAAQVDAERVSSAARGRIAAEELGAADEALLRARERRGEALVRAATSGTLVLTEGRNLLGRYVRRGELLGYVVAPGAPKVRVALRQSEVAQVREHTRAVEVRLSREPGRAWPAQLVSVVPAASDSLPSAALGTNGGGPIPVDRADERGLRALDPVFVADLALPSEAAPPEIGGRVRVRFEHPSEPLAAQGWRALRRLFLRRLDV